MGTAYDGQDSYFCNGFRSTDLYTVINNKMHSFEKKSWLHIALCALSLLAACASDPIGEEAPQPVGEPSQETAATRTTDRPRPGTCSRPSGSIPSVPHRTNMRWVRRSSKKRSSTSKTARPWRSKLPGTAPRTVMSER